MSFNRKIILLGFLFLALGAFASFFSFQKAERESWQILEKSSREVAGWASQSLEQRLLQLESSASYLSPTTLESMKNLGARYFAYVHKNPDEWSLNWKKLEGMEKEEILKEVGQIEFDEITDQKRTWSFNQKNEAIYITPVALADSHQLQEGFLVFGLKKDFFKFIQTDTSPVTLMTKDHLPLEGTWPGEFEGRKQKLDDGEPEMTTGQIETEDKRWILTSYFSPISQVWVIAKNNLSRLSYFQSLFFYYFLMGFLVFLLFFLFLLGLDFRVLPMTGWMFHWARKGIGLPAGLAFLSSKNDNQKKFKNKNPGEKKESEKSPPRHKKEEGFLIKTEHEESFSGVEIPGQILSVSEELESSTDGAETFGGEKLIRFSRNPGMDETFKISDKDLLEPKSGDQPQEVLFEKKIFSGKEAISLKDPFERTLSEDSVQEKEKPKRAEKSHHPSSKFKATPQVSGKKQLFSGDIEGYDKDFCGEDGKPPVFDEKEVSEEAPSLHELEKRVEMALNGFQLKSFGFKQDLIGKPRKTPEPSPVDTKNQLTTDKNGLFEFDNGQIKIKIRPPRKKDSNANP